MAITFEDEEKHSPVGTIVGVFLLLAFVGAGGFFGYRYLVSRQQAIVPPATAVILPNKDILTDPRLDSLELLPKIELGTETVGRSNPFEPPLAVDQVKTKPASTKTGAVSAGNAGAGAFDQSQPTPGALQQDISKSAGAQ